MLKLVRCQDCTVLEKEFLELMDKYKALCDYAEKLEDEITGMKMARIKFDEESG